MGVPQLLLVLALTGPQSSGAETGPTATKGDYRLAPTIGLSIGETHEELRLEHTDRDPTREVRGLLNTRLDLGFNYALGRRRSSLRIRGQSSLGVGLTYATGDWPLHLRQEFGLEYVAKPWFGLFAYAGAGFDITTTRPAFSAFVVTLPIGLRFGPVELIYRPGFRIGLASEQALVAGVVARRGARTGFAPFEVMLRVRIPIRGLR